jgi:HK97 family phage major capsid protein
MKIAEMHEKRKALTAERDTILTASEMTVEQEARGHEVANELQKLDGEIRAAQMRERFASYSAMEKAVEDGNKRNTDWTATTEYRDQWLGWCRGGRAPETRAIDTAASSGVLVPKVYEAGILKYVERNTVVRNLADLRTGVKGSVTIRVNTLETDAATSSFWTTEAAKAATDVDGAWAEVNMNPVGGLPKSELTQWVARQSDFDIETEIMDNLQRQIARGLESGYTIGTGTNQPTGLFNNLPAYKGLTSNYTAAHASGAGWDAAFTLARLTELRYKTLPAEYWSSAAWIMSQDAYYTIAQLVAASGSNVPIFVPSSDAGITTAASFTLMGRPVYIAPYAPGRQTAAVTNSIPLMFANVSEAFAIREWGGVNMFRDDVTTPGLVKFQGMVFANSKVVRPKAVAALRITLT